MLREKIESFELDDPGAALPFTSRLAREQGWTHAFAGRVATEYLRFIHLAMAAGHPITPSEEVDQAWHLHLIYSRRDLQRFDRRGHDSRLTDPYQIAYLSAGPARVSQLALARLIELGAVGWKPGMLGARLVPGFLADDTQLTEIERRMMEAVRRKGPKGIAVTDAVAAVESETRAIEVRLATAGLRPTSGERGRAGLAAVAPLLVLLAIGLLKFCVGIGRDKPVLFLFLLMILTLVLAIAIGTSGPRLTQTGKDVLARLRLEQERRGPSRASEDLSYQVALFGTAVLASVPAFAGFHREFEKQTRNAAAANQSGGGCGTTSSGCGGGGGCGGCGGGGD